MCSSRFCLTPLRWDKIILIINVIVNYLNYAHNLQMNFENYRGGCCPTVDVKSLAYDDASY